MIGERERVLATHAVVADPFACMVRLPREWPVSAAETIRVSRARRRLSVVRRESGVLFCRHPGGVLMPLDFGVRPDLVARAAGGFIRAYRPVTGDVVVNAGAGAETAVFADFVGPGGHVIAIEAHPVAYSELEALCRVNRLRQVSCFQLALADAPGELHLTDNPDAATNTVVGERGSLPVAADTLDRLLGRLGVSRVDFLKMNIEGSELRALEGFREGLARTRHVVVSCHDFLADADPAASAFRTKAAVRALLKSAGFDVSEGPSDLDPWDRDYLYGRNAHADV